jgi:hypothetical protein
MIIATRTLTVKTKAGGEGPVVIRLSAPEQRGEEWDCGYEIDWPADGWPAETIKGHAVGSDGIHALQLATQKLGLELHMTSYHREGAMRWLDGWVGYGFAVPKDARDLLKGDDATYFG